MKFWGHDFKTLMIASGTIFNEIVVWKLVCQHPRQLSTSAGQDLVVLSFSGDVHPLNYLHYEAEIISTLSGHQGSIFCLSWSKDGSKLVSVSDDRSARMWITNAAMNVTDDLSISCGPYLAGPVLFGHGARVWDCCISDSFIVTAGEDCTCRVWELDGTELRVIKEHSGRGIWRCLYDPNTSLLVTGGFDSAIKAHRLHSSVSAFSGECISEFEERRAEVLRVCIPNSSGHSGFIDSKSEYVRCLKCARKDVIYVATNHGYVYHAKLYESGSAEWTGLIRITEEIPVICMDLLSTNLDELSLEVEDWIAVGDGRGTMKIIKVVFRDGAPHVAVRISWSAEMDRQLLGAYWCKSLGCRFIFTSNPKGLVKLWRLSDSLSHDAVGNYDMYPVADFMSPFGARIMCLDATFEEEVLVCGDLRGNLILFPLSKRILLDSSIQAIEKTPFLTYFKGAHGISTVSSISMVKLSFNVIEICSTGGDGCICYLEYNRDQQIVEFVGMRHMKELNLIQSVVADHYSLDDLASVSYAVGFSSTDFLIWNLLSETKVLQVKCGGWRRPHSYYLGQTPEICSGFAYVKDEIIYVHRYWVPDGEKKTFPRNLHLQFHGREIHSLCFIPEDVQCATQYLDSKLSWVATGCEDGSVRLTRYGQGTDDWAMSNLLGEHVGGSAVRSLCFVSKVHSVEAKIVEAPNGTTRTNNFMENIEHPCLLISVGAKRVLTSWLLRKGKKNEGDTSADGLEHSYGSHSSSVGHISSMSFKWLSSDMPVKCVRVEKKTQSSGHLIRPSDEVRIENSSASMEMELKQHGDVQDNDWRYLAVTSFLVNAATSRFTVCFVIVACSDATLTLRALVLPYRYWFDVASLAPLSSPVLALQHVVAPLRQPYQGKTMTRNIYIAISGSTDGSIAFWDVTESIKAFMQRVSSLHVEKSIDFQKRPRTGRGSQGGRWWKSIDATLSAKEICADSMALSDKVVCSDNPVVDKTSAEMTLKAKKISSNHVKIASSKSEESFDDSSARFSEIKPLHVLHNVHQSGVNCLHICSQGNNLPYSLVSGGDDQAINILQFVVEPSVASPNSNDIGKEGDTTSKSRSPGHTMDYDSNQNYSIKFIHQNKPVAAHSSAVKGVWTNGILIFSTGLDQRLRCWKLQEHGDLTEHGHFITSVPEPEALDVRACGRNSYQVVVAGRGMQMVEISLSSENDRQQ
ncbi:uncharacterized protein LOC104894802 isoform X2 [Beta vulgaris subsp. vulgaris]|nr:uncharacterized protein LOC104894802 isoform X2 [Beta vulgaris subsp. vulgaris]XP_057251306.1 uncharacterized protein LOC104894802 isoform X2 [Beta vulgaris subsp. vulgaris]